MSLENSIKPDNVLSKLITEELRVANKHLPLRRKSLEELLSEDVPHVVCRDGSVHLFKKHELKEFSKYVESEARSRLNLPIILTIRPGVSETIIQIEDVQAVDVLMRVLGIRKPRNYLYVYELYELLRKFSTLFQLALSLEGVTEGQAFEES